MDQAWIKSITWQSCGPLLATLNIFQEEHEGEQRFFFHAGLMVDGEIRIISPWALKIGEVLNIVDDSLRCGGVSLVVGGEQIPITVPEGPPLAVVSAHIGIVTSEGTLYYFGQITNADYEKDADQFAAWVCQEMLRGKCFSELGTFMCFEDDD